ncbi:Trk system potassium transporter TrkA [Kallipyga massiliensis]|uniref:Trk system potassium transporter TrkA n=1 Tax=Kallipyga massiliensis TaxID=1472764 RepID=UPI0004B8DE97|nr:Trk system potassium transporter TrkA [Kallipyga massiliensis]
MKIVVCGAGEVGRAICESLWESNDLVLIDTDEDRVNDLYSTYDIQAIVGSATSINILREIDLSEEDVFLAVTSSDETNIIASILASELGVGHVYGRVRSTEYLEDMDFMQDALGVSRIVNPEMDAAVLISKILAFPAAESMESFSNNQIRIIELTVTEESSACNKTLMEFTKLFEGRMLICAVQRGDYVFIPNGNFEIHAGDKIHVTGKREDLKLVYQDMTRDPMTVRSLMILGGGDLTYYLVERLTKQTSMYIKVIEEDVEVGKKLALDFPMVDVVYGEAKDPLLLDAEGLESFDAVAALQNNDEENIILSSFAQDRAVPKIITRVDRPIILKHLTHLGLDTIITPKQLLAEKMIRLSRSLKATSHSSMIRLYQMVDDQVEAMEFHILNESSITGKPLRDIKLISSTLIIGIHRGDDYIIPNGSDSIEVGDDVSVITTHKNIKDIIQFVQEEK